MGRLRSASLFAITTSQAKKQKRQSPMMIGMCVMQDLHRNAADDEKQ